MSSGMINAKPIIKSNSAKIILEFENCKISSAGNSAVVIGDADKISLFCEIQKTSVSCGQKLSELELYESTAVDKIISLTSKSGNVRILINVESKNVQLGQVNSIVAAEKILAKTCVGKFRDI